MITLPLIHSGVFAFHVDDAKQARCVDPRYEVDFAKRNPLAQPGADDGSLMTLVAAQRAAGQEPDIAGLYRLLVTYLGGEKNLHIHSDHHAQHAHSPVPGCGHIAKAYAEPVAYGLKDGDMTAILTVEKSVLDSAEQCPVLHGEHQEHAVVIVQSETHSLVSANPAQQFFVYHQTLAEKRLHELAPLVGLAYEQLFAAHMLQLNATVERLAKHLPIYTVSIDAGGKVTEI